MIDSNSELTTLGIHFYPGMIWPFRHIPDETLRMLPGAETRFRLVIVENGTGIVRLNGKCSTFIAPTVFCLNEQDTPQLDQHRDLKAQAIYFHPALINNVFNFENIRSSIPFEGTPQQDLSLLRAFIDRDATYDGQLHVSPTVIRRLSALFEAIGCELSEQPDGYWPCRSRSIFLEALIIIFRLFMSPHGRTSEDHLVESSVDIDPVIMHLHTHYHEKLTIEVLSRAFHTNRTTLEERFREATGVPVMTYLTRLRIRIAATMLHDTSLPVGEVADRVGFRDKTHFGRTFRKLMGCSPVEYRQRYCWMLQ